MSLNFLHEMCILQIECKKKPHFLGGGGELKIIYKSLIDAGDFLFVLGCNLNIQINCQYIYFYGNL